jgi:sulfur carrier protein ThiS
LSVKGSGGVSATVVVTAQHGQVRVSIIPPFTWEAIMEPAKVDELIRTLGLAREDAIRMVNGKRLPRRDKQQSAGNGTVLPGS